MKLLRDDGLVAINDLISLSLEAAELYRSAAETAESAALAGRLADLAGRRQTLAERLIADLRRHHELPPTQPQDEKLLLQKALARVKATLAPSGDAQLLADCRAKEADLAEAAAAALAFPLSDEVRRPIAELRHEAEAGLPSD